MRWVVRPRRKLHCLRSAGGIEKLSRLLRKTCSQCLHSSATTVAFRFSATAKYIWFKGANFIFYTVFGYLVGAHGDPITRPLIDIKKMEASSTFTFYCSVTTKPNSPVQFQFVLFDSIQLSI